MSAIDKTVIIRVATVEVKPPSLKAVAAVSAVALSAFGLAYIIFKSRGGIK